MDATRNAKQGVAAKCWGVLCLIGHWLQRFFRRHVWGVITILLAGFFCFSVFIIYHFEGQQNPALTVLDAFRTALAFFFGEYGDSPSTVTGKVISIVLFLLSIGIVGTVIGKIASMFVNFNLEVKMPQELESHIVMCNWHDKADRIIKELHSPLASPETEIIVITEKELKESELRLNPEYERVFFVRSDPTMHSVLKRSRTHHAKSVIILADEDCSDPDAKTALIALAITKLEQDVPKKPRIVAEVINHHKIQHLIDAGVDEWVCSTDYGLGIIAQSALYGRVSEIYQQLLTYSEDTNEIYVVEEDKYPRIFLGRSFQKVTELLNKHRNPVNPAILIGVKRAGCVILNPKEDEFDVFKEGDSAIVMAFDQPDLMYLEDTQA